MTSRTHETIRVGLRRIIRDQNVGVKQRLEAIKLLMRVEGLMMEAGKSSSPKNDSTNHRISEAKSNRLRELLAMANEQKAEWGLPEARDSSICTNLSSHQDADS